MESSIFGTIPQVKLMASKLACSPSIRRYPMISILLEHWQKLTLSHPRSKALHTLPISLDVIHSLSSDLSLTAWQHKGVLTLSHLMKDNKLMSLSGLKT